MCSNSNLVQMAGIEPARFIQPQDFKSCASTSSATSAYLWLTKIIVLQTKYICQVYFLFFYLNFKFQQNQSLAKSTKIRTATNYIPFLHLLPKEKNCRSSPLYPMVSPKLIQWLCSALVLKNLANVQMKNCILLRKNIRKSVAITLSNKQCKHTFPAQI